VDNSAERRGARWRGPRNRKLPAAGWVAVGLLGAAVIAPASAVAASNLVGIVGANGTRAAVTAAGELETAETSPSSFVAAYGYGSDGDCTTIYKVPKGDGLIIRSVTFNTLATTSTGSGYYTGLFTAKKCAADDYILDNNPAGTGETTVPLDPGMAIKAGTTLYVKAPFGVESEVYLNGYLVPAKAVPANRIPVTALRAGAAQRR
jgi:hypothetical protein